MDPQHTTPAVVYLLQSAVSGNLISSVTRNGLVAVVLFSVHCFIVDVVNSEELTTRRCPARKELRCPGWRLALTLSGQLLSIAMCNCLHMAMAAYTHQL